MASNVKMEEGFSANFKNNMQNTFTFLEDCNDSLNDCQILEELGFDNGFIPAFKENISKIESSINTVLQNVFDSEQEILSLDRQGSERMETVFEDIYGDDGDNQQDTGESSQTTSTADGGSSSTSSGDGGSSSTSGGDGGSSSTSSGDGGSSSTSGGDGGSSSTSGGDGGSSSTSGDDGGSSSTSGGDGGSSSTSGGDGGSSNNNDGSIPSTNDNETNTNTDTIINENEPYMFRYDRDTAYKAGDIFIDDKYNLTSFTNYLLYKYDIKDEGVAKAIYQAVINYGNNYYDSNHKNPLTEVNESDILNELYKQLRSLIANSNEMTFWDNIKNVKI